MADNSIPDASVAEFVSVTAASPDDARQYLSATGGDVSAAVEAFYAGGGGGGGGAAPAAAPPTAAAAQTSSRPPPLSAAAAARAAVAAGPSSGDGGAKGKAPATGGGNGGGNVRSLADLRNAPRKNANDGDESDSDDEDSDEDGANEYYVGGDKSGQVVKGHPKDKKKGAPPSDPAALFDAARAAGAQDGRAEDLPGGGGGSAGAGGGSGSGGVFSGTGRTLAGGAAPAPSDAAGGGAATSSDAADQAAPAPAPPKPISHVIAFYDNGVFTVDDGPAREMADPANRDFLDAISVGRCPAELEPEVPSGAAAPGSEPIPISVNLVRKAGDYVKPAYVAFGGQGRTLAGGGGGGGAGGDDKGKAPAGAAAASPAAASASPAAGMTTWQGVDESKPTTSLQLRLRDGSRLVARFNLGHTVADIRRFISAAKPGGGESGYSLSSMGFPPKALEDDSVTIEEAGLANAVVVQK